MVTGKKTVVLLSFLLMPSMSIGAPKDEGSIPSEVEIANCLILASVNDEWYWVSEELKEKFDSESIVDPFESMLQNTRDMSCSLLFVEWNSAEKELLDSRIVKVCRDDLKNENPFLGKSLHCKQALALQ